MQSALHLVRQRIHLHRRQQNVAREVHAEIGKLVPVRLIEFTGGEPMLQERELVPLMQRLLDEGYELLIETSGERPLANVPKAVHKIVDVKCPQSGEGDTFNLANLDALTDRTRLSSSSPAAPTTNSPATSLANTGWWSG